MTAPDTWPDSMLLPTVSVFADGVWVADGRDDSDGPQALDGLQVTWGRSTVVDQPQPSTCSLTLIDRTGGSRFLDLVRVGGRLDVLADAIIGAPPDPDTGTGVVVISEGFEAGTGNAYTAPAGAASLTTAAGGSEGARALQVDTWTAAAPLITVPPAVRQPVGGDPTAWDDVPRSASGESWAAAADVKLPAPFAGWHDWAAELTPVSYTAPWDVGTPLAPLTTTAAQPGGWLRISGTFVPPPGVWLGVSVRFWPIGPAWDDLDASTWDDLPAVSATTWDELGRLLVDRVRLVAPAAGTLRRGMVFSGRVTDMEARYDDVDRATLVDVTAADQRAELGNRDVGDQPWLAEALGSRFARIVTASGQPIESRVSDTAAAYQVSWRDVDRQPAITLLSELATTADGVLWAATHPVTGPYLLLESLADRPALFVLAMGADNLVHIVAADPADVDALVIDACDVLLEPVRWRQDIEDMGTRVVVTWREQTLDDKGQPAPTDRTVTTANPQLEADIGVHRIAVGTQLAVQADAGLIADAILGRTGNTGWRISGLEWRADTTDQLDGEALTRMMRLLDGTTRNGLPILLTNLPAWSPIPDQRVGLYLEGGTYESVDGAWRLSLTVSAATATGMSAAWDELDPAWQWDQMAPDIRWVDLAGVAGP
jgi:hypothetical protein